MPPEAGWACSQCVRQCGAFRHFPDPLGIGTAPKKPKHSDICPKCVREGFLGGMAPGLQLRVCIAPIIKGAYEMAFETFFSASPSAERGFLRGNRNRRAGALAEGVPLKRPLFPHFWPRRNGASGATGQGGQNPGAFIWGKQSPLCPRPGAAPF